jgi:hypothetical protein
MKYAGQSPLTKNISFESDPPSRGSQRENRPHRNEITLAPIQASQPKTNNQSLTNCGSSWSLRHRTLSDVAWRLDRGGGARHLARWARHVIETCCDLIRRPTLQYHSTVSWMIEQRNMHHSTCTRRVARNLCLPGEAHDRARLATEECQLKLWHART